MLLHRYFGSHAFETLKETTLKAARISTFNDPFEFLYVAVGKMTPQKAKKIIEHKINFPDDSVHFWFQARQKYSNAKSDKELKQLVRKSIPQLVINLVRQFEDIKNRTLENRGVVADMNLRAICFCETDKIKPLDEILIWSHYADKHRGVRIGFEFPDGMKDPFKVAKITYQEKRVEIDLSITKSIEIGGGELMRSLETKSKAWEYEHEFRLFTTKAKCKKQKMPDSTTEFFLEFKKEWVKSVDFGVRCPLDDVERIIGVLKTSYSKDIICRKANYHESEYALKYDTI